MTKGLFSEGGPPAASSEKKAPMIYKDYVQLPRDRIGCLIGEEGAVKKRIQKELGVSLNVDSQTGMVEITLKDGEDPTKILKARELVQAIANGFSPEKAFKLLNEHYSLALIDLREYVGDNEKALTRVKGRIIGEGGRAKRNIEELTGAYLSIYGYYVAIIGSYEVLEAAKKAVKMLASGSTHSSVYRFLHVKKREIKRRRLLLWEPELKTPKKDIE
ncbi:MAG: KH domain-containing protein [Candidatus Nezhaarchaeales archaeon]